MEKFGIFELLDTLSALTAPAQQPPVSETPPQMEPNKQDAAFAPPAYPSANSTEQQPPPATAQDKDENAFALFLARHDALSKKIDEKK